MEVVISEEKLKEKQRQNSALEGDNIYFLPRSLIPADIYIPMESAIKNEN